LQKKNEKKRKREGLSVCARVSMARENGSHISNSL